MRRYINLVSLCETPLEDFGAHGDLSQEGTLRASDLKAVQNPKWQEKLVNFFRRTPFSFNIYVYNGQDGKMFFPYHQATDQGVVREPRKVEGLDHFGGVYDPVYFQKVFGFVPPNYEQSISVMLIENEGSERMPLTQWMVAHRVAHALMFGGRDTAYRGRASDAIRHALADYVRQLRRFTEQLRQKKRYGDDDSINDLVRNIGKTRSMRTGNLASAGEFYVELLAQYIIQGTITFQRPGGPTPGAFLDEWERALNAACQALLARCIGKIFVL